MLIIWRGLGILIPAIVFGFMLVANMLCNAQFGSDYWKRHNWPVGLALFAAAITCILCGRYFEGHRRRVEKEHKPGGFLPIRNDMFFINYIWWGVIILIISLLVLFGAVAAPNAALAR